MRYNSGIPILNGTQGWYDNDAVYSPTIILGLGAKIYLFNYFQDPANPARWLMIYAGHCYTNCSNGMGVFLLGAYSSDLVNWVKMPSPVFTTIGADSPYWWAGMNGYIKKLIPSAPSWRTCVVFL